MLQEALPGCINIQKHDLHLLFYSPMENKTYKSWFITALEKPKVANNKSKRRLHCEGREIPSSLDTNNSRSLHQHVNALFIIWPILDRCTLSVTRSAVEMNSQDTLST